MTQQTPEWWERARRVRDMLVAQLGAHPSVTMVDIGLLTPSRAAQPAPTQVGVRVHVRGSPEDLVVPVEVDGIAVGVMAGNYRLEAGADG